MTEPERTYHDTIAIVCPRALTPVLVDGELVDDERARALAVLLTAKAKRTLADEYPRATLRAVEWTFVTTPMEAEAWPLPHDCEDCAEGRRRAMVLLADDPGAVVALGDMLCSEPA